MRSFRVFVAVMTAVAAFCARAQQTTPTPTPGGALPHVREITLTGHFEAPLGPTATERAVRAVGEQIDARRAVDAIRSQFAPIWDLAVWRYLPADPVRTLNSRVASDDDPFLTPEYLKVSAGQLNYQLKISERATRDFFH
jgi:hypothetical protein